MDLLSCLCFDIALLFACMQSFDTIFANLVLWAWLGFGARGISSAGILNHVGNKLSAPMCHIPILISRLNISSYIMSYLEQKFPTIQECGGATKDRAENCAFSLVNCASFVPRTNQRFSVVLGASTQLQLESLLLAEIIKTANNWLPGVRG